ncbi:hypothetical protein GIB67_029748 [Kingdonia uniflora]|uniref:Uncharacterized protein n=1 Tax=Kingdonia uniflora TaxID=39325 RepID=A0A7J7LLY3_9MAGN|nr:hypothetical protein GIB67_029748 [Kingdonia uniflora]
MFVLSLQQQQRKPENEEAFLATAQQKSALGIHPHEQQGKMAMVGAPSAMSNLKMQELMSLQAKMAAMQKANETQPSRQLASKQQYISSPATGSENSAHLISSSDMSVSGLSIMAKAKQVIPSVSFASTPTSTMVNANNIKMQQLSRQTVTLNRTTPHSAVSSNDGGSSSHLPSQVGPKAPASQQLHGLTKQQLYVLKAHIMAFRRLKVEIKNMNSFLAIYKAIDFEISKQALLNIQSQGDQLVQETKLWEEGSQEKKSSTPAPRLRNTRVIAYNNPQNQDVQSSSKNPQGVSVQSQLQSSNPMVNNSPSLLMPLRGKLSILGKEAMQNRETSQKVALQALRDASATENLVRVLKTFSDLSRSARANAPSACFDQFLEFHKHIVEAIIFDQNNQSEFNSSKRRPVLQKSVLATSERNDQKANLGKHLRSTTRKGLSTSLTKLPLEIIFENDENEKPTTSCFSNTIKLGKHIKLEAGNWFMEFLKDALKKGLTKPTGPAANDARKSPSLLFLRLSIG